MTDNTSIQKTDKNLQERYFEPYLDVFEENRKVFCVLDMPGVEKGNVDITFDKGNLTVTGKVTRYIDEKWNLLSGEYRIGDYRRTIAFSDAVDPARIEAKLDNGVLTLTVPRRQELEKSIEIKVN